MKNKRLAGLCLTAILAGCNYSGKAIELDASLVPDQYQQERKTLIIGLDGVRVDALKKADTPNIDSLAEKGAYSFEMQADIPTWSGHEWSNVLTGVTAKKHGVTENMFRGKNYFEYPDIFTRLSYVEPELNTIPIVSWNGISDNILLGVNNLIYHENKYECESSVAEDAVYSLTEDNPDLMYLHILDVDKAGHSYGFHPDVWQYVKTIEDVDKQIGSIMESLKNRPNYEQENWLVLLTTDHGGTREGHGGATPEERTVFYIANGKDVVPGEIKPVPRHVDIVPTVLKHMRIPVNPSWGLDGKVAGLK
ncbi:MAG: alkaline phosphatase family protein [Nanoarchaeota archaeon]|nr:alkaline phosphatase family protein [Nanoarchaeota archaeon]MBU1643835.1 alkaline phosphatase family protein [Nanoarchaeota archaeon]MBU1977423.1 alkaline phosphatase family protein [Nanoarchaeota archaeon]